MTNQEFTDRFKAHIKQISFQQQLELGLSVCKKLYSDYQTFVARANWGNPDILMDSIKIIERSLTSEAETTELKSAIHAIESVTPDTDDFENSSYALNACTAVCDTLEFLLYKDPWHIYNTGIYLTDTIDAKIQESTRLTEYETDTHPEMIAARQFLLNIQV